MKKILIAACAVFLVTQTFPGHTKKAIDVKEPLLSTKAKYSEVPIVSVYPAYLASKIKVDPTPSAPPAPVCTKYSNELQIQLNHFYKKGKEDHAETKKFKHILTSLEGQNKGIVAPFELPQIISVTSKDKNLWEEDVKILSKLAATQLQCPTVDASLNSRKQRKQNRKTARHDHASFITITVNQKEAQQLDTKRLYGTRSKQAARMLTFKRYCEKQGKVPVILVNGKSTYTDIDLKFRPTQKQYAKRVWLDKQKDNLGTMLKFSKKVRRHFSTSDCYDANNTKKQVECQLLRRQAQRVKHAS